MSQLSETAIDRCTTAVAEVRERYWVGDRDGSWFVFQDADDPAFGGLDRAECQAWIDREATRACVAALLPVSDALVEVMYRNPPIPDDDVPDDAPSNWWERGQSASDFTAAITAVLEEKA